MEIDIPKFRVDLLCFRMWNDGRIMLQFLVDIFFKGRKKHRYKVHHASVVVAVPSREGTANSWTVQVIDVSLGGAAFIYEGSPAELAKSGLIKLSEGEAIKFKTVSDIESPEGPTFRRRGVQFKWSGVLGNEQIIRFINEHGLHAGGSEGLRPPGRPSNAPG
jgi:hypothetical protein